ncbi:thiamine diphosphokinase [Lysinibacillus sp. 54212]|uniref:thiamine diphosphokinase n=1 Tax=Lysinibacillus sp. 54212 TaxID=3119829 RepID=UPI002FCBC914
MIVAICSGGPNEEVYPLEKLEADVYVGVDRGASYLLARNITPTAIVGDFDSVSHTEWEEISTAVTHVESFQAEKDETDTDLALLKALEFNPTQIIVTGVTGGRLDHYEAAMRSVYRMQRINPKIQFIVVNKQNELQFLLPGRHELTSKKDFRYLSFFAYGEQVLDVTLRGVKYETTLETIEQSSSRFTSNEIVSNNAYIEFSKGICLMIRSID